MVLFLLQICRCACLLVGSEKRIDSPAIVMNMFYLLPKLHSPPGFFWKAFAELVKGPIVHLDLSMAVDLSVLFASHDCRNDALLVQVRSMLDKQGGGHSLRPDQVRVCFLTTTLLCFVFGLPMFICLLPPCSIGGLFLQVQPTDQP